MTQHSACGLALGIGLVVAAALGAHGSDRTPPPDKGPAAPLSSRRTVCHRSPNGRYSAQTVSASSFEKHIRHGDCAVDDRVACTSDSCDSLLGCVHTPNHDRCSDNVSCTGDRCIVGQGCQNTPDDSLCQDDGLFCTRETCTAGAGCGVVDRCPAFTDTENCLSYGRCDEDNQACPADPLAPCCGNGACEADEDFSTCSEDCGT